MTYVRSGDVGLGILGDFLADCQAAARRARVEFLPGRAGIAPDYGLEANPQCRNVMEGHSPWVEYLAGLHLRARCEFRVPVELLPPGARIVDDGGDREVLLAGQRTGEGWSIAASVLLGNEALIKFLLLPDGLEGFAAEHLRTGRRWSELKPRFTSSQPAFEVRRKEVAAEMWCTFTAEMDA